MGGLWRFNAPTYIYPMNFKSLHPKTKRRESKLASESKSFAAKEGMTRKGRQILLVSFFVATNFLANAQGISTVSRTAQSLAKGDTAGREMIGFSAKCQTKYVLNPKADSILQKVIANPNADPQEVFIGLKDSALLRNWNLSKEKYFPFHLIFMPINTGRSYFRNPLSGDFERVDLFIPDTATKISEKEFILSNKADSILRQVINGPFSIQLMVLEDTNKKGEIEAIKKLNFDPVIITLIMDNSDKHEGTYFLNPFSEEHEKVFLFIK